MVLIAKFDGVAVREEELREEEESHGVEKYPSRFSNFVNYFNV